MAPVKSKAVRVVSLTAVLSLVLTTMSSTFLLSQGASSPLQQRPLLSCHLDKHCIIDETCWIYCRSKGYHGGKGAVCQRSYRPWVCCCLQDQAQ
ncbi:unnamed protein product [Urochloa decumbens]|uniref:Uncharacterized protein n=1 Tax=Urochloa decumbens TaxID=240449 RepID=A0ABC9AYJ1_9POAL